MLNRTRMKIDDNFKRSVLLYLCNHDKAPNNDIKSALGVDGASISRVLQSLESYIITHQDRGNKRPRSLNQDTDTFATLLNMFVGTKDQKEFLASAYCKHMTQDWSPHCLAQAPPAQMSDSMRSVFDADEKEFPDASEPSFPIDAELVSLAVPPDDMHHIVGEMITEHATYLAQLIHRFYPKLQLNVALIGFLHEVERARQTGVATCTETT